MVGGPIPPTDAMELQGTWLGDRLLMLHGRAGNSHATAPPAPMPSWVTWPRASHAPDPNAKSSVLQAIARVTLCVLQHSLRHLEEV